MLFIINEQDGENIMMNNVTHLLWDVFNLFPETCSKDSSSKIQNGFPQVVHLENTDNRNGRSLLEKWTTELWTVNCVVKKERKFRETRALLAAFPPPVSVCFNSTALYNSMEPNTHNWIRSVQNVT